MAFVSHAKEDWAFVQPFAEALLALGIDARVYKWEKKAGPERYIEEAVNADKFVPVLSAASIRSRGVLAEINANGDRIVNDPDSVIPVILGGLPKGKFPEKLRGLEYVREDNPEQAAVQVARWIRGEKNPEKPAIIDRSFVGRPDWASTSTSSLAEIRRLAAGDAKAQNILGIMLAKGGEIPQDYVEAAKWFMRAAEQEHAVAHVYARHNLGILHAEGNGVEYDEEKAAKFFRYAAEHGVVQARFNLGCLHYNGRGVPQNDAEAEKWYRGAAELGHAGAQFFLGGMLSNKGNSQSNREAFIWYSLAALNGIQVALHSRDEIAKRMSPDELDAAKNAADQRNEEIRRKSAKSGK